MSTKYTKVLLSIFEEGIKVYERYQILLEDKSLTNYKVSKETGISQATLSDWKNGKSTPKNDKLQILADYFGVSLNYLLGIDYEGWEKQHNGNGDLTYDVKRIEKGVKIPVLGKVAAGIPIEAIEDVEDYEEISETMAKKGEHFGLHIQGLSMEPKFSEGDVVIVRKQSDIESGEIGLVIVNGQDATVKKVVKQDNGIVLVATNQTVYPPKFYSCDDVRNLPVQIVGKVVELRAKF